MNNVATAQVDAPRGHDAYATTLFRGEGTRRSNSTRRFFAIGAAGTTFGPAHCRVRDQPGVICVDRNRQSCNLAGSNRACDIAPSIDFPRASLLPAFGV